MSHWFDNKKAYIKDLKELTKNGYDFAERWGTEDILLKHRAMSL